MHYCIVGWIYCHGSGARQRWIQLKEYKSQYHDWNLCTTTQAGGLLCTRFSYTVVVSHPLVQNEMSNKEVLSMIGKVAVLK